MQDNNFTYAFYIFAYYVLMSIVPVYPQIFMLKYLSEQEGSSQDNLAVTREQYVRILSDRWKRDDDSNPSLNHPPDENEDDN